MTDADYADNQALFANKPALTESLLYSLEEAARGIGNYVNANKYFLCFKQEVATSILNGKPLKLVNQFRYHESNILHTENGCHRE